jgi:ubiquinone biosynthesis protein
MRLSVLTRVEGNARRLTEIISVLSRYGLADWLAGLNYEWLQGRLVSCNGERLGKLTHEARIRLALTELGTTFIKLGQILSTRADLVGPELAEELGQLRSNTPPDPPDAVRGTILSELGKPVEVLFAEFDDRALASASIGQVHRAQLANGQWVVVKVQHAGIEQKILEDLNITAGLAELLQKHVPRLRAYQPVATVREFRRILLNELNFGLERRNIEELTKNFANEPTVHFPAVYPDLCSRRVLTMEMLQGISAENTEALHQAKIDLDDLARRGANMYLEMIFRDGFYHADPHPGNLMVLPGGVIAVLDCGMVGRIDDRLREEIESLLLAVAQKDAGEVALVVERLGSVPPNLDHDALRADLSAFVEEYGSQSLRDFDLSGALNRMIEIIHQYQIILPPACSLLLKTLMVLEGTSRGLNPSFSLAELIEPFEAKIAGRRFRPARWLAKLKRAYRDWDRLIEAAPRDLADILHEIRRGALTVRQQNPRLEAAVNRLVLGILTAALLVASAELWSRDAPPVIAGISIPGLLGYLAALAFGFKMFLTIRKDRQSSNK